MTGWTDYPVFRRVEAVGRESYERVLFDCRPGGSLILSDYAWLSLMAWSPDAEVARLDQGLLLRLPRYHGGGSLTALMASAAAPAQVRKLLEDPDLGRSLHYVPSWLAGALTGDPTLEVIEDRDNFDYVHDVAEQLEADGARFREIRRRRRQFLRSHPGAVVACREDVASSAPAVLDVLDRWALDRSPTEQDEVANERRAVGRLLARDDLGHSLIVLLEIDRECVGFTVAEIQVDQTAVVHFMKTASRAHGATEILQEGMFKALSARGVGRLNIEQDLGVPGLRRRKLEENPSFLLEKFIVTIAHGVG